jgi:hypothetical protein
MRIASGALIACLLVSCAKTAPVSTTQSTSSDPDTIIAQQIANGLMARSRVPPKPDAAAYVRTTWGAYGAAVNESDAVRWPSMGDWVLVVKVCGDFVPEHSVPRGETPAPASLLLAVYDRTKAETIGSTFTNGTCPDVPGSKAAKGPDRNKKATFVDLRDLGTPVSLNV